MKKQILTIGALITFTLFSFSGIAQEGSVILEVDTKKETSECDAQEAEEVNDFDIEVDEDGNITVNPIEKFIQRTTVQNQIEEEVEDFDIAIDEDGNIITNPIQKLIDETTALFSLAL